MHKQKNGPFTIKSTYIIIIRHDLNKSTLAPKQSLEFNDKISTNGFQVKIIIKNMVCKSSSGFKFKIIARNKDIFQECLNTIFIKAKR